MVRKLHIEQAWSVKKLLKTPFKPAIEPFEPACLVNHFAPQVTSLPQVEHRIVSCCGMSDILCAAYYSSYKSCDYSLTPGPHISARWIVWRLVWPKGPAYVWTKTVNSLRPISSFAAITSTTDPLPADPSRQPASGVIKSGDNMVPAISVYFSVTTANATLIKKPTSLSSDVSLWAALVFLWQGENRD